MITFRTAFKISTLSVALIFATGLGHNAVAQDTLLINYQGYLTDAAGDPITGNPSITFTIYDFEGTAVWTEEHSAVPVTNGLFSLILGSYNPLVDWSPNSQLPYFLGIAVGSDDEMVPRTRLTSVFSAAVSKRVIGDISTAPGTIVIESATDDSAVVLMAEGETHVIQLYPPDPCVPPDSCEPAVEMLAEVDTHVLRVYPPEPCVPPEPCGPAFELVAGAEVHSMKVYPPDSDTATITLKANANESMIEIASPGSGTAARFGVDLPSGSSGMAFFPANFLNVAFAVIDVSSDSIRCGLDINWAISPVDSIPDIILEADATENVIEVMSIVDTTPAMRICADSVKSILDLRFNDESGSSDQPEIHLAVVSDTGLIHVGGAPPDDDKPVVEIMSTPNVATVIVQGEDLVGDPPKVAIVAGPEGAKVGIGTGAPAEALEVVGTAEVDGFKMATDAADGHVLTSDGDGNGTWQAPGVGGSKAACADMIEGMTNSSSQVTITFPVTFAAAPYFSVTGLIKSGSEAGEMANIVVSSVTTTDATITIQYWTGLLWDNIGDSVEMLLSYTAIEK